MDNMLIGHMASFFLYRNVMVDNEIVPGDALSRIVNDLKARKLSLPDSPTEQITFFENAGYKVRRGFVGKWSASGFQYIEATTVVTK